MRKWLYLLLGLVLFAAISKLNRRQTARSSFLKHLNETLSIVTWVLFAVYVATFLYWLIKQILS